MKMHKSPILIFEVIQPPLSLFFDLIFVHSTENRNNKTPYNPYKQGGRKVPHFAQPEIDCENTVPMLNYYQSIFPKKLAAAILTLL